MKTPMSHQRPTAARVATVAAVFAAASSGAGCNLILLDAFNTVPDNAIVGTIPAGDWIQSDHVGIAIASNVDYLPDPENDIVLSGSDPWQTIVVPIAPLGRTGDDGEPLTDAERVDTGGSLALDVPTDIEDDNRFGAALAYRDGLLLVGTPGLDTSRQGLVRTYTPLEPLGLDLPFGANLTDPNAMDVRSSFGISVAVGDMDGMGAPDAIVGDRGVAWWFPGPAMLPDTFDPAGAVSIPIAAPGVAWGSVVAASDGSFSGGGAGDDLAVADPDAGTVDIYYYDAAMMALVPDVSFTGLAGVASMAFLDNGGPMLAVGAVDSGTGGVVFLCAPAGTCVELTAPDAVGVAWRDVGRSVATGDLNGDGTGDIIAGAPESVVDMVVGAGAAIVWFGDGAGGVLTGEGEVLALRRLAPEENDKYGTAVAFLGTNLDADDCGEVGIGAPQKGGLFTKGLVLVYFELVSGGVALPGASNVDCF